MGSETRKLKCKHCDETVPDMPELRTHVRIKHPDAWRHFRRQMEAYDHAHNTELSSSCSICAHRGSSHA